MAIITYENKDTEYDCTQDLQAILADVRLKEIHIKGYVRTSEKININAHTVKLVVYGPWYFTGRGAVIEFLAACRYVDVDDMIIIKSNVPEPGEAFIIIHGEYMTFGHLHLEAPRDHRAA